MAVHKKIEKITFGVFSPRMIKDMAAAKIVTPELYDIEGYPVDGGLMDIRLGVIDPGLTCKTCGLRLKECPGHQGYIELARPVIHIFFVDMVLNVLRSTCRECGRVKLPEAEITKTIKRAEKTSEERGELQKKKYVSSVMAKLRNVNKCPHCKGRQQKIKLEKPTKFLENEKRLSPIEIRARLEMVPDNDLKVLGLNPEVVRPEWMILTVLPIPSVSMRPSITLESGERSEDDLTHKLGDIVRINQRLFENINAGAPEIIIEDLWDLLQYHVTTFFNNDVVQLPPARHRSGEPLKTISERVKSKEGRIRYNLAGKRTNFSARTVISPDCRLKVNEVGVPSIIACKLTIPERVQPWNIDYLKELVKLGPDKYPGATYVIRPDGKKKRITDETKEELLEEIQPGYVVERHLIDGDVAIFNRQPSLHRMSMMCHRIRVLPGSTFRLNVAVCKPYNADFDGDEMNLHIPQTEEARTEAETLMEVQTQLISPAYGLAIMGLTQDAITGNYLLTKKGTVMSREEAVELLFTSGSDTFPDPRKKEVTGKEVFSCLLPDDLNYIGHAKSYKPGQKPGEDDYVLIENGELVSGVMDTASLGSGGGLLLRTQHKEYGADKAMEIMSRMLLLGINVLFRRGFTTGLPDTDLPKEVIDEIEEQLRKAYAEVDNYIEKYYNNELEALPSRTVAQTLELEILKILNNARNEAGKIIAKHSSENNPTLIMAASGARGSILNLAQMAGVVGQQSLAGGRIAEGFKERTLSVFKKRDLRPTARGFIRNSYKSGLTPAEFFFGAMTGRDALMDTALRTPKSGYLYRRLSNAMQDIKVEYDGTVRGSAKNIIQFEYGEDGLDVSKTESGTINVKKIIEMVTK
ncbi:DNA-directed RNA polymerase subunit A' [Candidatus Woesearchaeota archaeon]|nr:DNA-directed RNA polymerase subunit A' [Candidatus Woesearchaeota archaeon]